MNPLTRLSPGATRMIRMDHSHVLMLFRKFRPDTPTERKRALVDNVCLALEVHAQLEEEIFYPALRSVANAEGVLDKSVPEHDEMRRLIARLRAMEPVGTDYDQTFMELIRDVLHHVADEETVLLPQAERLMPERLQELGAQMTRRRLQLLAPHKRALAATTARAMPVGTALVVAGAALAAGYLVHRASSSSRQWH